MGDVYRESRYREYDDGPSDDDRYKRTTVRRYKVKPSREDQYESVEVEDDYHSRYSSHPHNRDERHGHDFDRQDSYDRRSERPRSSFEPPQDRSRGGYYERDREVIEREYTPRRDSDHDRITVVEAKHEDDDDQRSRYGRHDDDNIKVERRVEDRWQDGRDGDYDHYRKETEYYTRASPPPQSPVYARERPREAQKVFVAEENRRPLHLPREDSGHSGAMVIRGKDRGDRELSRRDRGRDDDFYYTHERREVGRYHDDFDRERARDRDYAMARYDRYRKDQGYSSDEDDHYVRRRVVRRERSESPHHKRDLAAGALAGAGLTALMSSRRDDHGDLPENRGRKIIAGTALGALGTEAARRAHSAYEDRYHDGRESPDHHNHLKKGLGIAAVALAAAGAAKYYQSNKIDKEEAHRGRSRRRGRSQSGSDLSGSRSRTRTKSRRRSVSTAAKAALGTAAVAGLAQHYRSKSRKGRSGSRHSRSRSKSRLRKVAEVGGAAAAAGVAAKMYKSHQNKKEGEKSREASRDRDLSDDESDYRRRRSLSRRSMSRSRSRSQARSLHRDGGDPELGLVEYGDGTLSPDPNSHRGYESEAEERRRRRRRRRDRPASEDDSGDDRKRSKSRLRDMAAAGAAAIGIKEYANKDKDKKDRKSRERHSRDRGTDRSRDRSRDRSSRRNDDRDGYFDDRPPRSGSPPVTSGGAYYPPYPQTPGSGPPGAPPGQYTQYPNQSAEFQTYIPQDYTGYPPPPAPGPPPAQGYPAPPAPGPPPGPHQGGHLPPDHVSDETPDRARRRPRGDEEDGVDDVSSLSGVSSPESEPPPASKSVSFIPLSPESSRTMELHRQHQSDVHQDEESKDGDRQERRPPLGSRRRSSSDPLSNRSVTYRRGQARNRGSDSESTADDEVGNLPDRFDSRGRPLDSRTNRRDQYTTRSGEFERRPQRPGGWNVQGSWQVGGTDPEAVERVVRGVTGALDGRRGWTGVIGDILGSGLLGGAEGGQGGGGGKGGNDANKGRYRRR